MEFTGKINSELTSKRWTTAEATSSLHPQSRLLEIKTSPKDDIHEEEMRTLIAAVRCELSEMARKGDIYFGNGPGVEKRRAATLDPDAPRVELKAREGINVDYRTDIMKTIDLTILETDIPKEKMAEHDEKVKKLTLRAIAEKTATVCVYPADIPLVVKVLEENGVTDVLPIAVVGFPFVSEPTEDATRKTLEEVEKAIQNGAKEIDMVIPYMLSKITPENNTPEKCQQIIDYIKAVVDKAAESGVPVKVIQETAYLNDWQIVLGSFLSVNSGARFVKTSTGKAEDGKLPEGKKEGYPKGATLHDAALMRLTVNYYTYDSEGNKVPMGVKASGGVRDRFEVAAFVEKAGVDRIGASDGIKVVTDEEWNARAQKGTSEQKVTEVANVY